MVETINENLGEIVIAPEVLEVIVGIAGSKVDGVYCLRNKRILQTIGRKTDGEGVRVRSEEGTLSVDLYVYLVAGSRIAEVAQNLQREVKDEVRNHTDIEVDEVNVHVMGMISDSTEKPAFDDLFREGFFDVE